MVKVSWKSFLSGVIAGSALFSGISYAAPTLVKLIVNGQEIRSDVPPQIIDGSTMIPARRLAEALGAKVAWDESKRTVTVESQAYRDFHSGKADDLNEQAAVQLAAEAQNHYWHVSTGGGPGVELTKVFVVHGRELEYRSMGGDLDTKEKYIAYWEEVYTSEQAASYWQKQTETGGIVEADGKLMQPNADGGSLLDWSKSKAKLIQDGRERRTYRFTVPLGDEGFEERELVLRFTEGKGWRIDEAVGSVR